MRLTHVDRLSLEHDGKLPKSQLDAAIARDAFEFRRRAPAVRLRVKAWKPDAVIEQMAGALIDDATRWRYVTAKHLRRRGFTDEQIDTYGDQAVALATERRPDLACGVL